MRGRFPSAPLRRDQARQDTQYADRSADVKAIVDRQHEGFTLY
jgi:hypothetical protein